MLTINRLTKAFGARKVLNDINYNFPQGGIIALVGVNGAGKSTFLNILCGLEEYDSGMITKGKSSTIGYLPQDPNPEPQDSILLECMSGDEILFETKDKLDLVSKELEKEYSQEVYERFERLEEIFRDRDGYSFEYNASKILTGLGFPDEILKDNPKTLSGGWRMRLELAKLLMKKPDFLILDEPTNHLDLPTIIWLEGYLKKFRGVVLFVSHDESLLNRLPNIVLHLKNGKLTEYHGNYDQFLAQYEMREVGKIAERKNLESKIKDAQQFIDRFGAKATKATQARSRMKMIARMQGEFNEIEVDKDDMEIRIKIPLTEKSGKDVLEMKDCTIGYDKPLLRNLSLYIQSKQKVAIVGANGLGKSTLIKTIAGNVPQIDGSIKLGHNVKIAYYAQEQVEYLSLDKTVLENLRLINDKLEEFNARKILGSFLFKGDDIYKPVRVLSGGEKSRLGLACLMVQNANFLLLDEPTNHLDILSTEILSEALKNYEGTVIFISHNRSFINSTASHILAISSSKKIYLSKGNLDDLKPGWL
jgi:ATP-binding cassette subfamily F protein 3